MRFYELNTQPGMLESQEIKEKELDKTLNEKNIKISVITESKKKLKGTKEIWKLSGYLQWS